MVLGSVITVCVTVIVVAVLYRPRPAPLAPLTVLDERILDQVVVTLKSGSTFGGILYAEDQGAVVLAKAENIAADGKKTPADGEIVLLRETIDFIQRP